jgi:hypothetical protein
VTPAADGFWQTLDEGIRSMARARIDIAPTDVCEKHPPSNEVTSSLFAMLGESALDMLQSCGVSAARRVADEAKIADGTCLASFIGFTGARLRGCLTVVGPRAVFLRTHPSRDMETPISEADIADWCCEFANQLLGRFKNKLLRRLVDIDLSTPRGIHADRLRLESNSGAMVFVAVYDVEGRELLISLDVTADEGLTLGDCAPEGDTADEGDLLLL